MASQRVAVRGLFAVPDALRQVFDNNRMKGHPCSGFKDTLPVATGVHIETEATVKDLSLGLKEALSLVVRNVEPLGVESLHLVDCVGRTAARDLFALVDSPSMDSSRKDGYAVASRETASANPRDPVRLRILGSIGAGEVKDIQIEPGTAVRMLTGAPIPSGADAVVAEEDVKRSGNDVLIESSVERGQNVLPHGSDVSSGECIIQSGRQISPLTAGLLAAAGHSLLPVFRTPTVGIVAIGDELVQPGSVLPDGSVYESNTVTLAGWCGRYGMKACTMMVKDDHGAISKATKVLIGKTDAVLTSGGSWLGDHDMVAQVLEDLGWKKIFHRIRIGPGKGAGFGIVDQKPVFILAGGPPSNLIGFLEIALPGLLTLSGYSSPGLPSMEARLASGLSGGTADWTDFFFGTIEYADGLPTFCPQVKHTRLNSIAKATAVVAIPEGQDSLPEGSTVRVQLLGQV